MIEFRTFCQIRALVWSILDNPYSYQWTSQGLGMLRIYLDADRVYRLHIWHNSLVVPGVSGLHTHPWHFDSLIVSGKFINRRYISRSHGSLYKWAAIKCGAEVSPDGPQGEIPLVLRTEETFFTGDEYCQTKHEIHETDIPLNGTVTLCKRRFDGDPDHATIFWPALLPWVSAAPRPATHDEILFCTDAAKKNWTKYALD